MRGEVLKADGASGPGLILGDDGKRYQFTAARVHKGAALREGAAVDFIALGEEARDIYALASVTTVPAVHNPEAAYVPAVATKSEGMFKYFWRTITRNYFRFTGRARRAEYFSYNLVFICVLVALFIADTAISARYFGYVDGMGGSVWPILSGLFFLYCLVPGIAITVRRLHDQDMSGWLYLINFLPYIGGLIIFILMFFNSRLQPNKHGQSPKYVAAQTAQVFS